MKSLYSFPKHDSLEILTNLSAFSLVFLTFWVTIALVVHITCLHAYSAQVTLAWDPPNSYSDGTPLDELGGYRVYTGNTPGNYSPPIDVGKVTTYTVKNLTDGNTYYFSVTAFDMAGNESGYSNEVSKTIPVVYSITTTSDGNGTITPLGNPPVSQASSGASVVKMVTVNQGSSQSFTITPNAGYRVADIKADGTSLGAVEMYTFRNVIADHSLDAMFAMNSYSITSSAGTGGSISPVGKATMNYGSSQTYTIIPSTGYRIGGVVVDGVSVGVVSTYTFSNIAANHTISTTFAVKTYTISATSGTGGSISPAGKATMNYGSSQTYTITPSTGYRIADVIVDGVSVGAVSVYTFSNVTANHTITATMDYDLSIEIAIHTISAVVAVKTYTISAVSGTGGVISPSGMSTVKRGASKTYKITHTRGYKIKSVSVDGVSIGPVSNYTFRNVRAGHTIVVTCIKI